MKTSEMIAMLEKNPKLKFSAKDSGLIYSYDGRTIVCQSLGGSPTSSMNVFELNKYEYELIREPVPVWEAVKAFTEGKRVSCHRSRGLQGCHCVFNDLSDGIKICPIGFTKGTWYIEQGE